MKKVIVCFCAVVCIVLACLVPCSAETWNEETPTYGLPLSGSPVWANGVNNTRKVIEIVEKATELGIFGGAHPVLIVYQYSASNEQMKIMVVVPSASPNGYYNGILGGSKKTTFMHYYNTIALYNNVVIKETLERVPFVLYCLQYSGDWAVVDYFNREDYLQTSTEQIGSQTSTIYKKVAIWSTDTERWVAPPTISDDIVGWGTETNEIQGLQAVIDKYDEQIEQLNAEPISPVSPVIPSYKLDIAEIFDGYFNGVRGILSGFDINLFGINIIGVLIAFLVIAIVAFIVRKLWK